MNVRLFLVITILLIPLSVAFAEEPDASSALETSNLGEAERQARVELTLARSRLELVMARKSLQSLDMTNAALRAAMVLTLLEGTPPEVDVNGYGLQAEGILARAEKAGVDLALLEEPASKRPSRRISDDYLMRQAWASYDRVLKDADENGRIEAPEITFPADWRRRTERRAQYAGGEIARSGSRFDVDGREWFVSLYDIRDLTYVPPDFQPPFSLYAMEGLRGGLDRHALRMGYGAFGGFYSWEMSTLAPMLRAFGGFDDYAWRGPKYSARRQAQVVRMIEAFTDETPSTEPKIISLEP